MAANIVQEWDVYYKNEHKVYVEMMRNLSLEVFVITLLKKPDVTMGFKIAMRNVKNDLDFYTTHVIAPMYNEMKRMYNLCSDFPSLHKNVEMILDANNLDTNHVSLRLQENNNGSLQIKICYLNGLREEILLIYPIGMRRAFDIIYFLRREIEYEENVGKDAVFRVNNAERELQEERVKNERILAERHVNCERITELETRNEQMWLENYQYRMHIIEIDSANKINFRNLISAEETIKHLNKVIIELRVDQNSANLGIPNFTRTVSSLSEDLETATRTPMSRRQFFDMLDIFSTGVLELAKVGTKLTRIMAVRQEPNSVNMHFRSAVLAQTRLIAVLQDIWKGSRISVEEANAIRKMIEKLTYEIVRRYGNRPARRSSAVAGGSESRAGEGAGAGAEGGTGAEAGARTGAGAEGEAGAEAEESATAGAEGGAGADAGFESRARAEIYPRNGIRHGAGTQFGAGIGLLSELGAATGSGAGIRSRTGIRPGSVVRSAFGMRSGAEIRYGTRIRLGTGTVPGAETGIESRAEILYTSGSRPRSEYATVSENGVTHRRRTVTENGYSSGTGNESGTETTALLLTGVLYGEAASPSDIN